MSNVIVADYRNPEFVQAVVGGLVYLGRIADKPVDEISATVNAEHQLVVTDGEKTIIFEAFDDVAQPVRPKCEGDNHVYPAYPNLGDCLCRRYSSDPRSAL